MAIGAYRHNQEATDGRVLGIFDVADASGESVASSICDAPVFGEFKYGYFATRPERRRRRRCHAAGWHTGESHRRGRAFRLCDPDTCIGCQLCNVACWVGAHQCIQADPDGSRPLMIDERACVGCNLCQIVCPVPGCIEMVEVDNGYSPLSWNEHLHGLGRLRPKKGAH